MKKRKRLRELFLPSIAVAAAGSAALFIAMTVRTHGLQTSHSNEPGKTTAGVTDTTNSTNTSSNQTPENNSPNTSSGGRVEISSNTADTVTANSTATVSDGVVNSPSSNNTDRVDPSNLSGATSQNPTSLSSNNFPSASSNVPTSSSPSNGTSSTGAPVPIKDPLKPADTSASVSSIQLDCIELGWTYGEDQIPPLELNGNGDTLIFTAKDSQGNPISGAVFDITSSNTDVAEVLFRSVTNPTNGMQDDVTWSDTNGQMMFYVNPNRVTGTTQIRVRCGNLTKSFPITVLHHEAKMTVQVAQNKVIANSGKPDRVTGRVTDENGNPIAGLYLYASSGNPNSIRVPGSTPLVTDSNGEVQFDAIPGSLATLEVYVGIDDPHATEAFASTPIEVDWLTKGQ